MILNLLLFLLLCPARAASLERPAPAVPGRFEAGTLDAARPVADVPAGEPRFHESLLERPAPLVAAGPPSDPAAAVVAPPPPAGPQGPRPAPAPLEVWLLVPLIILGSAAAYWALFSAIGEVLSLIDVGSAPGFDPF